MCVRDGKRRPSAGDFPGDLPVAYTSCSRATFRATFRSPLHIMFAVELPGDLPVALHIMFVGDPTHPLIDRIIFRSICMPCGYTCMQANKPYRVSHRLRGFDYSSPGAYFVTLCTYHKRCLFGAVRRGKVELSALGKIAVEEWTKTPELRRGVKLGEFEVMPDHLHGIIII